MPETLALRVATTKNVPNVKVSVGFADKQCLDGTGRFAKSVEALASSRKIPPGRNPGEPTTLNAAVIPHRQRQPILIKGKP